MEGHWKIWFLRGVAKHQYIGGNCIKGGAQTVCRFKRGGLREEVVFLRGVDNPFAHYVKNALFITYLKQNEVYVTRSEHWSRKHIYTYQTSTFWFYFYFCFFYFLLMFDWNKYASNSIWFYGLLNNYLSFYFNESLTNNLLTPLSLHWQLAPWHLPIITWVFLQCKASSPTTKATGTQGSCLSQKTVQSQ